MLDGHMQQWSALQTLHAAKLTIDDVIPEYLDAGGESDGIDIRGYLTGLIMMPPAERDLIAQAINELLDLTGSLADGAHYSTDDVAAGSGYADYLRSLVLSPDAYDFTAPPACDRSTGTERPVGPDGDAPPISPYSPPDPGLLEFEDDAGDDAEVRRCQALYESGMLDAGPEDRFDRITAQAREHFGVSSASIALITEDAQVIKSVIGPIGQDLPRHLALCATTIEADRTLVITDAGTDPAWRDHPLVAGGPKVRFYAGHPLSTIDGWRIGTLCLIDDRPRTFTEDDYRALRILAHQAQTEIWTGS